MSIAILERLAEAGELQLLRLTEEELAAVDADAASALQTESPPEWMRALADDARTLVLRTALRSLIARGLVRPPTEDELERTGEAQRLDLQALAELDLVLTIRRHTAAVSFVRRGGLLTVLHAFRSEEREGVLEERFDRSGFRTFVLRGFPETVEWLADLAVPGGEGGDGEPVLAPCQVDAAQLMRDLTDADTWIEAYHNRAAGNRRTSARVLVGDEGVHVVGTAFGVDPRPPTALTVNGAGLRRWLRAILADEDLPTT